MRQELSDLNADHTARTRRPAFTVAAGLIALAITAAVVVEQGDGPALTPSDRAAPLAAMSMEGKAVTETTSADDPAKPHFERSDEPAVEETEHAYGG